MSDEPTNESDAEVLAALDAEVSDGIYESDHEALHGWMAITQLPITLDMKQVLEQVRPEVDTYCDVKWVLTEMAKTEYGTDEAHALIDKMGDASKVLLNALQTELTARGMGNAQLFVYLPCHGGYGLVLFDSEKGPRIAIF